MSPLKLIVLILCCGSFLQPANAQVKQPKQSAGSSVSGTVTIKGKRAPGITVALRGAQSYSSADPVFQAKTDQDGKYRITDVPPGSYRVLPVAPGYVPSTIDISTMRGETVVLQDGDTVEGIDFSLVRGGVITGKVVDANGRPVIEERVNLIPVNSPNTQPAMVTMHNSMTDDRGIYRIFGLAAGRYKVYAGQSDDNFYMTVSGGRTSYKQTFHPNVTAESEATVIEVTEGSEATNVDITFGPATQTFAVSGRVINGETGAPVARAQLGLQIGFDEQRRSYVGSSATSNNKGEFKLENLPPGSYAVLVSPDPNSELRFDGAKFEIVNSDVEGLVVKSMKGASLSGRVVLENPEDKTAFERLLQLNVHAMVQTASGMTGFVQRAAIAPDGSFRVGGLQAGTIYLSLGGRDMNPAKGFTIARIEKDQVVQPPAIEIKAGDQITGLQVIVSYGSAVVRGTVKFINGTLPQDGQIFLRITRAGERSVRIASPPVDSRGRFIINDLPAGNYDVFVTVVTNPRSVPTTKHLISVLDGTTTDVTLTVDLAATPARQP